MLKHRGGHKVGKGTYWNFSTGERIDVSVEEVLPGNGDTAYYRLPASGILLMGPVLGLLYAAFLPFIGIAMLTKLAIQKVTGTVLQPARSSASFGWRPSESYLAGKKKSEPAEKDEGKEGTQDKTE